MDKELISILVCPVSLAQLTYDKDKSELICLSEKLAFKIENGIANMLLDEARELTTTEIDELRAKRKQKNRRLDEV